MECPEILYHYCSLSTLSKIIGEFNKQADNLSHANDKSTETGAKEDDYGRNIQSSVQMTSFHHLNDPMESIMIKSLFSGKSEDYFSYILSKTKTFVFCLSAEEDNLTMWRAYGDDGHGVCIGFNTKKMKDLIKNIRADISDPNSICIELGKVGYVHDDSDLNRLEKEKLLVCRDVSSGVDASSLSKQALLERAVNCWMVKSKDYEVEDEWRLVVSLWNDYFNGDFLERNGKAGYFKYLDLRYRFFNREMTERLFLRLDNNCISSIILGPKCQAKKSEVERYLKIYRYPKCIVKNSEKVYKG